MNLVAAVQILHLEAGVAATAVLVFVAVHLWRWKRVLSSVRNDAERYAIVEDGSGNRYKRQA